MSKSMIDLITNIFKDLEEVVNENVSDIIVLEKRREIEPNPNYNVEICDILKHTKCELYNMSHTIKCMLLKYDNSFFLLYPYELNIDNNWTYVSEAYYKEGFGLLAMGYSFLTPHPNDSYEIYNKILGSSLSKFIFDDIVCYYPKYTIIQDIPETNELKYVEDIYRITAIFLTHDLVYTTNILTETTYINLSSLLNLKSSRCISLCIIRCLDSSLLEHCFLELYRCIEFLFYLQISFDIVSKYKDINLDVIIDLVCNREILKREQDTLESIIKNIEGTPSIDKFYNFLVENKYIPKNEDNSSSNKKKTVYKSHIIAVHIYELRCKTAHLSYKHEYISSDYKWRDSIEYLSYIILDIYYNLDEKIINACDTNKIWKRIQ